MPESADEHRRLHQRLDEVRDVATEARDEARGAHNQAKRTNGRVDALEGEYLTISRAVWGDPTSLDNRESGVVGAMRTLRRDIRIVGFVISGLLVPILWLLAQPYLEYLMGG